MKRSAAGGATTSISTPRPASIGIEAFYEQCVANGVTIIKPLAATAWGTKDFYIDDPDGYIICFGGRPA